MTDKKQKLDYGISRNKVLEIFGYVMDYWKEHAIDVEPHEIKDALIEQYEFTSKELSELPPITQEIRPFRKFTDLSKDEIEQIVNDIFQPKKITNIEKHKRDEEITCTIYTEWESYDDYGKLEIDLIPDTLTLRNPFDYGEDAIEANFQVRYADYLQLKQFCFAKGIYSERLIKDNPYLQNEVKESKQDEIETIPEGDMTTIEKNEDEIEISL